MTKEEKAEYMREYMREKRLREKATLSGEVIEKVERRKKTPVRYDPICYKINCPTCLNEFAFSPEQLKQLEEMYPKDHSEELDKLLRILKGTSADGGNRPV